MSRSLHWIWSVLTTVVFTEALSDVSSIDLSNLDKSLAAAKRSAAQAKARANANAKAAQDKSEDVIKFP